MRDHANELRLRTMAKVLGVHISGYHAWQKSPQSQRATEDQRLTGLIKHAWLSSGTVYASQSLR